MVGRPVKSLGWLGAEVGQVLLGLVEGVSEVAGGVAGVGQLCGCSGDGRTGVGVVVASDAVGVVLGVQPVAELVEQLRQAPGELDEFADEPVELRRPGEGVGAAGVVVQFADGLRGGVGEFDRAGVSLRIGHRPPPVDVVVLAGVWRCR